MNAKQRQPNKGKSFLLLALALVVVVGIGLFVWSKVQAGEITLGQATPTAAGGDTAGGYKTTTVRRSDLSLEVSGSGTVITARSVDLVFSVEGTVATLNVEAGDEVTQGQVLATLGDTATLKQTILDQQLAVQVAQKMLDDLQNGTAGALAQAKADQAAAEQAYAEALKNVHQEGDARCSKSKTQEYYFKYLSAQKAVDLWESYLNDPDTGYGRDFILENLSPLRTKRDQAYLNYTYCQGYTKQEIVSSQADLQLAKAKLDQANIVFEKLQANAGIDMDAVEIAQATLENANLQLAKAQTQLAGTVITAPMDGTVTKVYGKVGDDVDTSTFITLSDLHQPQVQVNIDETDLQNFATGCAAEVIFDSLPGETFPGVVTQVSPVLVTVNSASMVQGLVELQKQQTAAGKMLSVGLTASVEVTCKQAKNALIAPAQALYEPEGQPAYVYVLNEQGQPEKREVVIGLRTVASAEITSGLSEGEKIITSKVEEQ